MNKCIDTLDLFDTLGGTGTQPAAQAANDADTVPDNTTATDPKKIINTELSEQYEGELSEQYEQPFFMDAQNSKPPFFIASENSENQTPTSGNNQAIAASNGDPDFFDGVSEALHTAAKAYASQISRKIKQDGYQPLALHGYTDKTGIPLYYKVRLKHPDTKDKWIRAISPKMEGNGWQTKEPDFSTVYPDGQGKKPLYRLSDIAKADLDQIIHFFEGEQKADLAAGLGLTATTTGGTGSINSTHLQPLAGRNVVIWADNDKAGLSARDELTGALQAIGCNVQWIDLAPLELPDKGDILDYVELRAQDGIDTTRADIEQLAVIAPPCRNLAVPCGNHGVTDEVLLGFSEGENQTINNNDADNDKADIITIINELAQLPALVYEQCRQEQAKILGMRASALDKFVNAARKELEAASAADSLFDDVTPYPEAVDGALLLEQIKAIIERHIVCTPATSTAAALWIMFSWCIDAAQIAPIACITAPEKRCGKTQLLTLIGELVYKPMPVSNITAAALFRSIEKWQPTLLIDEADSFMKENEDLRGIINAGHSRKNAYVIRTTGDNHEPTRFTVWGAKAISGIGHLPETLKDRSIILELQRKQAHEKRQRLRHTDPAEFELLRCKLARWAGDNLDALKQARPELPEALNDRAQDNWEILLAIADLLGEDWSKKARHAALSISGIDEHSPSINEELLGDIQAILNRINQVKIFSDDLINHLCMDDDLMWSTWNRGKPFTKRQLAGRLSEFGINSKKVRIGNTVLSGYEIADFKPVFKRYLPKTPNLNVTSLQANNTNAYSDIQNVTATDSVTHENKLKALNTNGCNDVTHENPLNSFKAEKPSYVTDQAKQSDHQTTSKRGIL